MAWILLCMGVSAGMYGTEIRLIHSVALGAFDTSTMTQHETVLISGKLMGMGRLADCILRAKKTITHGGDVCEYREITIEDAPQDLPEGHYELAFDAQVRVVQRLCGKWVNHFWNM